MAMMKISSGSMKLLGFSEMDPDCYHSKGVDIMKIGIDEWCISGNVIYIPRVTIKSQEDMDKLLVMLNLI